MEIQGKRSGESTLKGSLLEGKGIGQTWCYMKKS